jgi:hypothetical protein
MLPKNEGRHRDFECRTRAHFDLSANTNRTRNRRGSSGSDGVNLNRSPLDVLAEPARFYLLGAFCRGPKSPRRDADDPFEMKGKLALVREPGAERNLRQAEFTVCPQEVLGSFQCGVRSHTGAAAIQWPL